MSELRRCGTCTGSGKVMGGGMIFKDCEDCDGVGKIDEEYTKAIDRLKETGLSETESKQYLDDELSKKNVRKKKQKTS